MRENGFVGPLDGWPGFGAVLGARIREARIRAGLGVAESAEAAGMSAAAYRRLERGVGGLGAPVDPRLRVLVALAERFGIALEELVPELGRRPGPAAPDR